MHDDGWQRVTLADLPPFTTVDTALEPAPAPRVCPDCAGVGYYKEAVPVEHPHFGVLFPCQCMRAQRAERAQADLRRMSNLEPFRSKTFASFDGTRPGVDAAWQAAQTFARDLAGWIVLSGGYGCGKTHLAAAIANHALARNVPVLFTIVPDLLDHLRATFGPSSERAYDTRFAAVRDVPLLILDDLGTEQSTPWAREKLFQIINHRSNYALPTVATTNQRCDDMDPRIASRLADPSRCRWIAMPAAEYRRSATR